MRLPSLALTLCLALVVNGVTLEEYMEHRNSYFEAEDEYLIGHDLTLDTLETEVNEILMKFKSREFREGLSSNGDYFPAAQHFFHAREHIEASNVFKIIESLPKGAALHMHDFTVGPSEYVATVLSTWENLYYCIGPDRHLLFKFSLEQPGGVCDTLSGNQYQLVADFRANASSAEYVDNYFQQEMSMVTPRPDVDYPDGDRAWYFFEKKITTISGIANYEPAFRDYYYQTLQKFYDDNVMYIEMRGLFNEVYHMNGTLLTPLQVVQLYKEETERFKVDHPAFWGAKAIYAPHRFQTETVMGDHLQDALEMQATFPEFFAGFDMVGQEDKGGPLLSFVPQLLDAGAKGLKFFFHSGETAWRGTPIDENLFDAILLNTTRIGHGYALAAHPHLLKLVAEKGIGVELCPVSNQVLNLVKDVRNHPGKAMLQNGFPVVIASDGPGIWGSRGLSHDFYYAFMGMAGSRADLKFLKQLALNSITYSAMSTDEKTLAFSKFNESWTYAIGRILEYYGSGGNELDSRKP